jgi:hypothetical protein
MGGVFFERDTTATQEVQFTALRYVAKKLFITQSIHFQYTKLVKIQKQSGKNSNYFQIFRPANILLIVIILNLDYIKGYTQRAKFEFKRFCTKSCFKI